MSCVVAGSGITGMAAALLLARLGQAVTLVEARPQAAPLLRGFRRNGLYFDTGFHSGGGLHEGGILRHWLKVLGIEGSLRNISTGHTDLFRFADGSNYTLPSGQDRVLEAAGRQFPGSGPGMRAFMQQTDAVLAHSPYTNPAVRHEPGFSLDQQRSMMHVLGEARFPAHLRAMLSTRCLLYGALPEQAAWHEYALVAGPYFQSSGTWDGGGAALADAMLEALRRAEVRVLCGAAVTGLDAAPKTGMRAAHLADGTRLPCELCIFTGHPNQLEGLLPKGLLRPAYYKRIQALPETPSGLLLFAETLDDVLRDDESIYLLPAADAPELFPCEDEPEPSVYLFCGRAENTPRRKAVLAIALMREEHMPPGNPKPRPQSYTRWKTEAAARLARHIERRVPELRGAWRVLDAATTLSFRNWLHGGTGSLYGIRHDMAELPLLPLTRIPGLFLAGQNILLPGVLGGIVSAALAAGFALGHDKALKEFRACASNG
jgi:all-trans-retinol 13,14-reductase